ncbi:hypothetical protein HNP48_002256 [Acidovorax soli]|uniref:Uncharacterized protein n=1 Tax=Acidovorax soli TaxID=592050 RepID=A0A7X0U989_9BURK|nr:hypothetical protein [Acidovorax soli]MBB6559589.1 hypothetical protein [Acidovorax soli]
MPTIKINDNRLNQFGGAAQYGNVTTLRYPVATNAAGAVIGSNSAAAVAAGDVIDLGPLPSGFLLEDAQLLVKVGMTATITGSLGFKYEDGVNDTKVPEDAALFGTGLNLATAGRIRTATSRLVTLPKPARLILTTAVAANAKASDIVAIVHGERMGAA